MTSKAKGALVGTFVSLAVAVGARPEQDPLETSVEHAQANLIKEDLGGGVYVFRAPSDLEYWTSTNSVVIVNDDDVTVFDSCTRALTARAVIAEIDGEPVGMAFGVAERGWCGVYGMSTVPGMRRRGIAQTVLRALARDAPNLYLQVERDNAAARALYDNVGFTHAYGYHYRVKR